MERDAPFYRVGHSWQMQQKICQLINCKCNVEFKSWTNIQPNSFHPHTHNTHIHSVTETASFALRILRRPFDKFLVAAQRSLSTGFARIYFPIDGCPSGKSLDFVCHLSIYLSIEEEEEEEENVMECRQKLSFDDPPGSHLTTFLSCGLRCYPWLRSPRIHPSSHISRSTGTSK